MLNMSFKRSTTVNTVMSSRYVMATLSLKSPRHRSINRWKFAGAFINPNGVLTHSYSPYDVTNAVAALLSLFINPW